MPTSGEDVFKTYKMLTSSWLDVARYTPKCQCPIYKRVVPINKSYNNRMATCISKLTFIIVLTGNPAESDWHFMHNLWKNMQYFRMVHAERCPAFKELRKL